MTTSLQGSGELHWGYWAAGHKKKSDQKQVSNHQATGKNKNKDIVLGTWGAEGCAGACEAG